MLGVRMECHKLHRQNTEEQYAISLFHTISDTFYKNNLLISFCFKKTSYLCTFSMLKGYGLHLIQRTLIILVFYLSIPIKSCTFARKSLDYVCLL